MTDFELLKGGFTSGLEFGYANIGKSSETTGHTYFCNGTENWFRFSGVYATYASDDGVNVITIQGAVSPATLGFTATGSLTINGTVITYTGLAGQTFTGCSAIPAGMVAGDYIIQTPVELTAGTAPIKGKVAMAHDGRLHARNEAKKSVWNYSKLDDPSDFTAGSTDGDGGAKEVEFGGPIVAFGKLNKTALCFKNRIIKLLNFNQVGTRLDSPVYQTLVTVDDKGTTLGAVNQKSTFSTPLGMVFVTPDKRMVLLTGVTANNEPQYLFLSDPIQTVFNNGVHDSATGICLDNVIYYAFKTDINSTYNDVVIRGDLTRQTVTSDGKVLPIAWDTPIIGWNVSDFTILYSSTNGSNELHWHSSINSSTYKTIEDKTDNALPYTGIIRSWSENFGAPDRQKKIDYLFIEVKMTDNTDLTATILYDEDGVTQQEEYSLIGTETDFRFNSSTYNPFGASAFGSQKIGSNPENPNLKTYRFYLETGNNIYFYNIALQLSCSEPGNDFQLTRFGYRITELLEEPDRKLKKNIT